LKERIPTGTCIRGGRLETRETVRREEGKEGGREGKGVRGEEKKEAKVVGFALL